MKTETDKGVKKAAAKPKPTVKAPTTKRAPAKRTAPQKAAAKPAVADALNAELKGQQIFAVNTQEEGRVGLRSVQVTANETEVEVSGVKFTVRDYLTPEEKTTLAQVIAGVSVTLDEDLGRATQVPLREVYELLLVVQAYTNLHISLEDALGTYDKLHHSGILEKVLEHCGRDSETVLGIARRVVKAAITYFDARHSFEYQFRQISSGDSMGQEFLEMVQRAAEETAVEATQAEEAMSEMRSSNTNNIVSFAKRKRE